MNEDDDLKSFLFALRQALLMIIRFIERRYNIEPRKLKTNP
jgi:hypothetical protein